MLRSLRSVLGFLLKFITGVLYMSFVSYFMLFQIVNMPQVTSLFLLLPSLIYFLWNAYRHIVMFWGVVTYVHAPLGSDSFWPWELASLRSHEKGLQINIPDLGNAIPLSHRVHVGHSETEWWMYWDAVDEHFFKVTFYLGIMLYL